MQDWPRLSRLLKQRECCKPHEQDFLQLPTLPLLKRLNYKSWKLGRAVECSSLENCRGCESSVSSNLTASASTLYFMRVAGVFLVLPHFSPYFLIALPWLALGRFGCSAELPAKPMTALSPTVWANRSRQAIAFSPPAQWPHINNKAA